MRVQQVISSTALGLIGGIALLFAASAGLGWVVMMGYMLLVVALVVGLKVQHFDGFKDRFIFTFVASLVANVIAFFGTVLFLSNTAAISAAGQLARLAFLVGLSIAISLFLSYLSQPIKSLAH